jgi:uncharacterized peroxidase-related enzyme
VIEKTMPDVDTFIEGLERDYRALDLDEADRAMLDYATKLTRAPNEMNADDVEVLRAYGFDDRAIHDICAIAAYYAFVNRIADGLGVELE